MSRAKKKARLRLKNTAKRLAAYSAAAAATAMSAGDRSANADEVIHDIPDFAFTGLGVHFNMISGAYAAATGSQDNRNSFRVGSFPVYFDDDLAIQGPAGSAGVGFVGTPGFGNLYAYADKLGFGSTVGTNNAFAGNNAYLAYGVYAFLTGAGKDFVGSRGVVGIQFQIGGSTHYGWADISGTVGATPGDANNATGPGGVLHAFGYNDTPGAATTPVPEPSSMLLLAAGAAGLAGWRRRRKAG